VSIPPLAGFVVAVTADRRAEEQTLLLQRRGAEVVHAPAVRTLPIVDGDQLAARIEDLIARPPDVLVLLTGIGTRSLFAAAEGLGLDAALADALAGSRIVARGPKATGAATTVGLQVAWSAASERSDEILRHLAADARAGARVAVQRDGQRAPSFADSLAALGADAVDVPVYRWELPLDTRPALRLVQSVVDRSVDAVTFTSKPALCHLVELAAGAGLDDALVVALSTDVVPVCIGPVCAETAASLGITDVVVPARARLGAMVLSLAAVLGARSRTIATAPAEVTLQGRALFVDGVASPLGGRERAVLTLLADAEGAVVPKSRLLRDVWGPDFDDDHAVEVAVGRLRRALGPAGGAVETVARRGYRLGSCPTPRPAAAGAVT